MDQKKIESVDTYIKSFPPPIQEILKRVRQTIRLAAPEAEETISYQMPTYKLHGNLVHFAAYKNHLGFYPTPIGINKFEAELAAYKGGKGTVQFPLSQDLPYDLIRRIVEYRVKVNLEKSMVKAVKRKGGESFLSLLPAPARRALESKKIQTLQQLSKHTETEILQLHGFGPSSLPKLKKSLNDAGLSFAED